MTDESRTIPYSGQIMGVIVEALDIKDEELVNRTAKRYYSGETVSEYSLTQIFTALGKRLVELHIVPVPPMLERFDVSMPIITTASIARLATKWDNLCATIQSRSGIIQDIPKATEGFCRLFIIDLALRVVAWLRLSELPVPEPVTPLWAEHNGAGKMLRLLLSQAGISREQFNARVGVSHISIDNWFDGKIRPVPEHIEAMVEEFSKLIPGSTKQSLQIQVQRQFTLAYLADMMAGRIGREAVAELATVLYRFTWLISEDIKEMNRPPIREACGSEFELLRFGVAKPQSHTLLRNLAMVEKNPDWKKDILASITGWDTQFEQIALSSNLPAASAGLAQELPQEAQQEDIRDGTANDLTKLGEATLLSAQDHVRLAAGDLKLIKEKFKQGIHDRRIIVNHHPTSAQAHMQLGSFLGMIGKHLHSREMADKGIAECKIAAALCEGWDTPLVESGIILINIGEYEEALTELEAALRKLPALTPHLAFSRGYVLMQTKKYHQALQDFEFVITLRPNYALALDYAAHCSFMTKEHDKGMKYAKEARKYGESQTYLDWRRGLYKERNDVN